MYGSAYSPLTEAMSGSVFQKSPPYPNRPPRFFY